MTTRIPLVVSLAALVVSLASASVSADTVIGLYSGAAVGGSVSRSEDNAAFTHQDLKFNQDTAAWEGFIGARPLPLLGVELAYIDFGSASGPAPRTPFFGYFKDNSKQNATTLTGVGYLPLAIPFLELYGKLGVARLHSETQASYLPPSCPIRVNCTVPYTVHQSQSSTDVAYGGGAQTRVGRLGIRAEYERISASARNSDLLALGVFWNF